MLKLNVKFNNQLASMCNKQKAEMRKIPEEAYKVFVNETPVGDPNRWKSKSKPKNYVPGNARRNTKLKNKKDIVANYPYAQRLDKENWSSQAPNGMTEPTLEYIEKRFLQIMSGK